METLIIFLLFVVFSVIRSIGGQGQQQGRPRYPSPPVRPQPRPERRDVLPPPVADPGLDRYYDEPSPRLRVVHDHDGDSRGLPAVVETVPVRQIKPADSEQPLLQLKADSLLFGIVFSEVLGEPRARRRMARPKVDN